MQNEKKIIEGEKKGELKDVKNENIKENTQKSEKKDEKIIGEKKLKDRKLPKNIKENPPSKGKASSSKEKKSNNKKR